MHSAERISAVRVELNRYLVPACADIFELQLIRREDYLPRVNAVDKYIGQRTVVVRDGNFDIPAGAVNAEAVGHTAAVERQTLISYTAERELFGTLYELFEPAANLDAEVAEQIAPFDIRALAERENNIENILSLLYLRQIDGLYRFVNIPAGHGVVDRLTVERYLRFLRVLKREGHAVERERTVYSESELDFMLGHRLVNDPRLHHRTASKREAELFAADIVSPEKLLFFAAQLVAVKRKTRHVKKHYIRLVELIFRLAGNCNFLVLALLRLSILTLGAAVIEP